MIHLPVQPDQSNPSNPSNQAEQHNPSNQSNPSNQAEQHNPSYQYDQYDKSNQRNHNIYQSSSKSISRSICRDVSIANKPHFVMNRVQSNGLNGSNEFKAAFSTDKLWPTGTVITVGFIGGQSWQWAWIAKLVTENIMVYANLTFQFNFTPSQANSCMIRIAFDTSDGCYSYLGTDALDSSLSGYNTMNFGWMDAPFNTNFTFNGVSYKTPAWFDQGGYPGIGTTIIHEFGHALGMIHEHQTPFSNPIVWNKPLVYSIFEGPPNNWTKDIIDHNIINRYSVTNMNGSIFDGLSIMKYSFPASLLVNPSVTLANYIDQTNFILSDCDKHWLKQNYLGRNVATSCNITSLITSPSPTPPTPPTPPPTTSTSSTFIIILLLLVVAIVIALIIYYNK